MLSPDSCCCGTAWLVVTSNSWRGTTTWEHKDRNKHHCRRILSLVVNALYGISGRAEDMHLCALIDLSRFFERLRYGLDQLLAFDADRFGVQCTGHSLRAMEWSCLHLRSPPLASQLCWKGTLRWSAWSGSGIVPQLAGSTHMWFKAMTLGSSQSPGTAALPLPGTTSPGSLSKCYRVRVSSAIQWSLTSWRQVRWQCSVSASILGLD
jgi:hypothetical protein